MNGKTDVHNHAVFHKVLITPLWDISEDQRPIYGALGNRRDAHRLWCLLWRRRFLLLYIRCGRNTPSLTSTPPTREGPKGYYINT